MVVSSIELIVHQHPRRHQLRGGGASAPNNSIKRSMESYIAFNTSGMSFRKFAPRYFESSLLRMSSFDNGDFASSSLLRLLVRH